MRREDWLNKQVENPEKTSDYYSLYDDFRETFDAELTMESYKRVVRSAFSEMNGGICNTSKEGISSETRSDGSIEVRLKTFDFQTEEDLMLASKLDPAIWEISNFRFRATQNGTNPYLVTQAIFEKKIKDLKYPLIEQVKVEIPKYENIGRETADAVLNLSDLHAPFHDESVMKIAVQVAREVNPATIILNGDFLDCTDISRFSTTIKARNRIQESINVVAKFIGQLRSVCPNSKIIYLEGNHEDRLRKVILDNVAGAVGLKRANDLDGYEALSIPNLLCLKEMNIEWMPYTANGYWVTDNLKFHHGEELNVTKMAKESDYDYVIGHGHRVEIVTSSKKVREGQKENYTAMFGCMCRCDGSVPSVKTFMNWQQAFGVVYYSEKYSAPVPVYVHNGTALFNGVVYTA